MNDAHPDTFETTNPTDRALFWQGCGFGFLCAAFLAAAAVMWLAGVAAGWW